MCSILIHVRCVCLFRRRHVREPSLKQGGKLNEDNETKVDSEGVDDDGAAKVVDLKGDKNI